ncbi:MAG: quinone oxidoreductase [Burkholderiales bacterium]|nr:quinone oxidoreductase [Burkholderiales bacterium]
MSRAVVIHQSGGPDVLKVESIVVGDPGPGQIRIRQTFVGVNFHDCYVRSGAYTTLPLPGVPGLEAVGVVEAVGSGVAHLRIGDHVGYISRGYGAYADLRLIDASVPVKLPEAIHDRTAAATMLRGLTAQMLLFDVFPVRAGHTVLVHAAAGGVGRLLCRWAKHLGATVIGTVGSPEKALLARKNGCDHTILYRTENFVDRVREITGGRGVDVAYDSVGKDTFLGSIQALAVRGHLANFGQSSGPIEPFAVSLLFEKSNSVSRPGVFHYFVGKDRETMAARWFQAIADGIITADECHEYAFDGAPRAHADMEARKTSGAVLLKA